MSLTKRWIDEQTMMGNDPLNDNHEDFVDDVHQYEVWCRQIKEVEEHPYDDGENLDIE